MERGFKNNSYPGGITLRPRDTIELVAIATDNFDDPARTRSNVKAFITGTLSWRLQSDAKSGAVSENL